MPTGWKTKNRGKLKTQGQGYLGFGVLRGSMSLPSVSTTISGVAFTGSADKKTDTGFKLYGGYNFNQNWGIEGGYNDLGDSYSAKGTIGGTPYTITGMKGYNVYFAGTGTLPMTNEFSLFAKLGVASNHTDGGTVTVAGTTGTVGSETHTDLLFGVGLSYAFTKNWAARLEYENYGKLTGNDVWGTGSSGAIKGSAWNLSAKYSF
jgi:OOP family OmpA-OmpF porin